MPQNGHLKTYLALSMAMILWGFSFVATKIALESFQVFSLVFIRFSIAALVFGGFMFRRGIPVMPLRDHGLMLLLALFEPGLYFLFETYGLKYTTAPKAALIIATIPLTVMVFAHLLLGERITRRGMWGAGLSLAGVALLVAGDPALDLVGSSSLLGDLLIGGAVLSATFYILCARRLGRTHSAVAITAMQIFYGVLFYIPLFLWELPRMQWQGITPSAGAALTYLALGPTIGAYFGYNYALTRIPASHAAIFINAIPFITAAGAWWLLGETLTLVQASGGGAVVLMGVWICNLPRRRSRK